MAHVRQPVHCSTCAARLIRVVWNYRQHRADPDNLVLFCHRCHLWVHSLENINHEYLGQGHRSVGR